NHEKSNVDVPSFSFKLVSLTSMPQPMADPSSAALGRSQSVAAAMTVANEAKCKYEPNFEGSMGADHERSGPSANRRDSAAIQRPPSYVAARRHHDCCLEAAAAWPETRSYLASVRRACGESRRIRPARCAARSRRTALGRWCRQSESAAARK